MKKLLLLTFVISMFMYACGPSVEGETKAWSSNLEQLSKLKTNYPLYAKVIDEAVAKAKSVHESAAKIKDDDEKADKLREANNILNTGCVGSLKNMKSKISDINGKIDKLKKVRRGMAPSDVTYADIVIKDAKETINDAENVLALKEAAGDPCDKLTSAYDNLEMAYSDLSKSISKLESKKREKSKTSSTVAGDSKTSKTDTKKDDTPKKIKCGYCGSYNDAKATKCASCGAPVGNK